MAETKKSAWKTVGSLRKGEKGNLYIKITEGVTLNTGDSIQLQDPRKRNQTLADKGFITQEEAESRNAKIPEYVKYDVVMGPPKA